MIHTHTLPWDKCLSHQLMPAIEKGWKDEDKEIHFFWGLGGANRELIKECIVNKKEWWYVDVGYFTQQITRYPAPKIHDYDKTYFRIVKGDIHSNKGKVGPGRRIVDLESKGIDVTFKGWNMGETKHILLCPSSDTVTRECNGMSQEEYIQQVTKDLKQHTNREIRVRNKPRPGNEWWGTDVKDDLKNAWCVVTNMSLSAIDGVLNMTPAFTHQRHVASLITSQRIEEVEKPFKPEREKVEEWLNMVANHQFTIQEIEDGLAFDTLKVQYQNGG